MIGVVPTASCPVRSVPLRKLNIANSQFCACNVHCGCSVNTQLVRVDRQWRVCTERRYADAIPVAAGHAVGNANGHTSAVDAVLAVGVSAAKCFDRFCGMLEGWNKQCSFLAMAVPVVPGGWHDLWRNRIFLAGFLAWFLAQFGKIFTKRLRTGKWDIYAFRDSGGMPSSHSAMCMAVTSSIALQEGMGSPLFAVALCFSAIVMYDAAGVRKHAGYQAQVLNALVRGLPEDSPLSARRLKEVLGHTPGQVVAGCLLGIACGLFVPVP